MVRHQLWPPGVPTDDWWHWGWQNQLCCDKGPVTPWQKLHSDRAVHRALFPKQGSTLHRHQWQRGHLKRWQRACTVFKHLEWDARQTDQQEGQGSLPYPVCKRSPLRSLCTPRVSKGPGTDGTPSDWPGYQVDYRKDIWTCPARCRSGENHTDTDGGKGFHTGVDKFPEKRHLRPCIWGSRRIQTVSVDDFTGKKHSKWWKLHREQRAQPPVHRLL